MFIEDEEVADNIEEVTETEEVVTEQSTSPVDQTKAFAARLKAEKAKAKQEAKEEIAKSFGYDSWQDYADAQTNNTLLDRGLDPDSVRPVLKDLIKNDPDYLEAMRYKAEKEELEKELFASNSLKALNDKFGTNFTSINELDEETINDWNKGTPLEKAFAANNYSTIIEMQVKKRTSVIDNGKSHLKTVTATGEQPKNREISKDELAVARSFGFTEEQYRNYVNRTKK